MEIDPPIAAKEWSVTLLARSPGLVAPVRCACYSAWPTSVALCGGL